jgi:hypothetical protein
MFGLALDLLEAIDELVELFLGLVDVAALVVSDHLLARLGQILIGLAVYDFEVVARLLLCPPLAAAMFGLCTRLPP